MSSKGAWVGILLATGLLASLPAFGQTVQTARASEISRITRQASRIDNSLSGNAAIMKTFTHGDESGVLSLYADGDNTRKLVVQVASLDSGDVTEYYFHDNQLIYVVSACRNFGSNGDRRSAGGCATISEDRFFVSKGDLVAWLRGKGPGPISMREVAADRRAFEAKLSQLVQSASTWMEFVESPLSSFDRFEAERRNGS